MLEIRPFAAGDVPALHAAVRASIASLSRLFPWCGADYALAVPGRIVFEGRPSDAVLFSLSAGIPA